MSTFVPNITPADAADKLRALLGGDPTVYALTRHVSRSGMQRRMSLFIVNAHPGPYADKLVDVTVDVAAVLGYRVRGEDHTIAVNGAGMDMQYHIVYSLSRALYRDMPDNMIPTSHGHNSDRDAGYVLTKRTL